MRALKHTIFAILLIALLKILRLILDRLSPGTEVFHAQLVYVSQIVVLSALMASFLLNLLPRKLSFFRVLLLWIFFIMICDVVFFMILNRPYLIPTYASKAFRNFYTNVERSIIQYHSAAVYDSISFYNFMPDTTFRFQNIEFDNIVATNSRGFRDDEPSLEGPEVICLGDSYTLGWGVDQNECFPQLIEKMSGKKVLNCGMSSFGTAREMLRLFQCDRSRLKYIIVQYCKNDVGENLAFAKNSDSLHIGAENDFESARSGYNRLKVYYPGKYAVNISDNLAREKLRKALGLRSTKYYLSEDPEKCAEYFLRVIGHYREWLGNVKLIVIDINPPDDLDGRFIRAVDSLLTTRTYTDLHKNVCTIDVSATFSAGDFYQLDVHLTSAGHHKLAKKIVQYIHE